LREVKTLKNLPSVKEGRLIVGSPSLTDPIALSKKFEFALVSYHENIAALEEYEASEEHHRYEGCTSAVCNIPINHLQSVTSTYMFPFDEDLCRFDFEVDPEDEYMCAFGPLSVLTGIIPSNKPPRNGKGE
jgi:hypothetical protein